MKVAMRHYLFSFLLILPLAATPSVRFLQEFERYAEEQRIEWEIPGMAIAVVQGDQVLFEKCFGQRGLSDPKPVDEHTLFQIGSLTKAFTSALVALGEEEGKYSWDTKVSMLLKDFQMADPWVTREFEVQDLMSQRSGLPSYAGDNQSIVGFTPKEIYHNLVHIAPATSFRTSFAYQNVLFLIAAMMMEKVGLGTYEEQLQKKIFTPLGMSESSVTLEAYKQSSNSAQWTLLQEDGEWQNLGRSYPFDQWTYIYAPAGGINSTLRDMTKWTMLQANGGVYKGKRLLSEKSIRTLHRPYVFVGEKGGLEVFYAQGWLRVEDSPYPIICHDGSTMGVNNALGVIPEEKLGIVVLTNARGPEMALALMFDFFNRYHEKKVPSMSQAMLSARKDISPTIKRGKSALPLEKYSGTYENDIYGEVVVEENAGILELTLGPKKAKMQLVPWKENSFTLFWKIMDESHSKVLFCLDAEGNPERMDIEFLSKEGSGRFRRSK